MVFCTQETKTFFDNLLFEMQSYFAIVMAWDGILYDREIEFEAMVVGHSNHFIEVCGCPGDKLLYKDNRKKTITKIYEGKEVLSLKQTFLGWANILAVHLQFEQKKIFKFFQWALKGFALQITLLQV